MPLPGNITTITVTGTYQTPLGAALTGTLAFTPNVPTLADSAGADFIIGPIIVDLDPAGHFSVTLPCTDNTTLSPSGWLWQITENITGHATRPAYLVALPHTLGATVDLATVVPQNPSPAYSTFYGVLGQPNTWTGTNNFTAAEVTVADPVNALDPVNLEYFNSHGAGLTYGSPGASAVGDTIAAGTSTNVSRADHRHGREAYGAPTAQFAYGLASAAGTATADARADHTHGTPSQTDREALMLGLAAQPFPPHAVNHVDLGATSGILIAMLIRPGIRTINNLGLWLGTAGITPNGVNAMALFDETATQLAITGDMSTALSSSGNNGTYVEAAVGTPVTTAEATDYYVTLLCHMATPPLIAGAFTPSVPNLPAIKGHRAGVEVSGQATIPASFNPAAGTLAPASFWLVAS
jgi:hypothetical protein